MMLNVYRNILKIDHHGIPQYLYNICIIFIPGYNGLQCFNYKCITLPKYIVKYTKT